MKIESWNVNGLRSVMNKTFFEYVQTHKPDVLCLQEIKAKEEQVLDKLSVLKDYKFYFNSAKRPGYSGTALFTKEKPQKISFGLGNQDFDEEGRTIISEYEKFYLINSYTPNGKRDKSRVPFKMSYNKLLLKKMISLRKKKEIILCGDLNTAHKELDLARPNANKKNTGFLPEERAWIDQLISHGFIDTFRSFNSKPDNYTYWDVKTNARERNVGWRIDYFFVSPGLAKKLKDAYILTNVRGSDHCPVGLKI